jgi:hypothetical protein
MTRVARIALFSLLTVTSAHPEDIQNSFVEFKDEKQTITFDLRTVEVMQPGKFTIVETTVLNADVMRFELKVIDTLRSHCARPLGFYTAPAEVFTLGPPDVPVKEIEVGSRPAVAGITGPYKLVSWWLPYFKTMAGTGAEYRSYRCDPGPYLETEARNVILNGTKSKTLYDCNRALRGYFFEDQNDYSKARIWPVKSGTVGAEWYKGVCKAVTRKDPYLE